MSKKEMSVSHQYIVTAPLQEGCVLVPFSTWKQIMVRLRKCSASTSSIESAAWMCLGSAVSLFVSTITFFFSVEFFHGDTPKWGVVIAEFALAILAVIFGIAGWTLRELAKTQKNAQADIIQFVLEDMAILGDRYMPSSEAKKIGDDALRSIGLEVETEPPPNP